MQAVIKDAQKVCRQPQEGLGHMSLAGVQQRPTPEPGNA